MTGNSAVLRAAGRWMAVAALLRTLVPAVLSAQDAPRVEPGERVRVSAPALGVESRVGRVVAGTPDTLAVRWERGGDIAALPVPMLRQLDRSRGSEVHRVRRGLIGAAVGALATAGVLWIAVETSDDPNAELFGLIYGQFLLPAGALAGGIGGALTAPVRERWEPVPLVSVAAGAPPLPWRARVRVVAPGVLRRPLMGEVIDRRGGALVVVADDGGEVEVPLGAVQRLEVSRGRNRAGRALLGGAIGGAVGAAYGAGVQLANQDEFTTGRDVIWTAGFTGAVAAGMGAVAGALTAPERWVASGARLAVSPAPGGGIILGVLLPIR